MVFRDYFLRNHFPFIQRADPSDSVLTSIKQPIADKSKLFSGLTEILLQMIHASVFQRGRSCRSRLSLQFSRLTAYIRHLTSQTIYCLQKDTFRP